MYCKLIGAFLLAVGGAGMGRYIGSYLKLRQRELERLKNALLIIYSDTEFGRTCLEDSCLRATRGTSSATYAILTDFASRLNQNLGEEVSEMWKASVNSNKGVLAEEDVVHLLALGDGIGSADYTLQLSAIRSVISYIDDKCKYIAGESGTRLRLCQSTGLMFGLMLAVLLF